MIITWDESKRIANLTKHGLDFAEITLAILVSAPVRKTRGNRLLAIGRLDAARLVAIVFAPLGTEALAIISVRPASKKERFFAP